MLKQLRAAVWIDTEKVSFAQVGYHYQDDPWPAGHTYRIRIDGEVPEAIESDLAEFQASDAPNTLTQDVFWAIESTVGRHPGPMMEFVLNTIDTVEWDDTGVTIAGRCSRRIVDPLRQPQ